MNQVLQFFKGPLFEVIIIISVFGIFLIWLKSRMSVWQGYFAEQEILRNLLKLDPQSYLVAYDTMLPSAGNSKSTQIDHVVVSNYGVFCLEVKDYSGWIFGESKDKYWTQVIYKNKQRFFNPLRQNYVHVKAMESLLKTELKIPIVPLVVFTSADKLKISGTDLVINKRELNEKILSYQQPIYTDEERDRIYHLLMNNNIIDKKLRKGHVKEVRNLRNR